MEVAEERESGEDKSMIGRFRAAVIFFSSAFETQFWWDLEFGERRKKTATGGESWSTDRRWLPPQ